MMCAILDLFSRSLCVTVCLAVTHLAIFDTCSLHYHSPTTQDAVLNVAAVPNSHAILQDAVQHLCAHPKSAKRPQVAGKHTIVRFGR